MSSIPLLGGLALVSVATTLTLLAGTELQFQHRALVNEAEALALVVTENATPQDMQSASALTELADAWAIRVLPRFSATTSLAASTNDGETVAVRVCERAHSWSLPWLDGIAAMPPVCGVGLARAV
jgi:hypothetical protein